MFSPQLRHKTNSREPSVIIESINKKQPFLFPNNDIKMLESKNFKCLSISSSNIKKIVSNAKTFIEEEKF